MKKQDVYNQFDVDGKVALITGATGAFGTVAAETLCACGAKVMMTGRTIDKLQAAVEKVTVDGGTASYMEGDPANHEDVKRVVQKTVEIYGGIDILITAAGMSKPGAITEQSLEEWETIMNANIKGTYLFCKEAGKILIEQGRGGKVILLGSQRGNLGLANYTGYSPSKGAVHLLAKSLACEWGPHKINVNCLAPAVFRAAITSWIYDDENVMKAFLAREPIGRLGEPEDFGGIVLYLSSKASDWVTGSIINIDGGYSAG